MESRVTQIRAAQSVLEEGGPPLAAKTSPESGYYNPAVGDDEGIYLYVPLAGALLNVDDPSVLMRWFFLVLMGVALAFYPLVFYELFGSILVALVSPLVVAALLPLSEAGNNYWVPAWAVLACLPPMLLLYKRWTRRSIIPLALLMVVASFAATFRSGAGLALLLTAALIVLLRERAWRVRLAMILVLLAGYVSVNVVAFSGVREYRNSVLDQPDFSEQFPTAHPFWHTAYIGLGYLPNDHGIRYQDQVAIDAVRDVDPEIGYLTHEYESTLRGLYFDVVRDDPGFATGSYLAKTGVLLSFAYENFALAPLLIVLMCAFGPRRGLFRRYALLVVPALVITAVAPILAKPAAGYETAWLASLGFACLLGLAWLLSDGAAAVERGLATADSPADALARLRERVPEARARLTTKTVAIGVLVVAAVVGLAVSGPLTAGVRDDAFFLAGTGTSHPERCGHRSRPRAVGVRRRRALVVDGLRRRRRADGRGIGSHHDPRRDHVPARIRVEMASVGLLCGLVRW